MVYRWLYCDNKTVCTYSNSERSGTIHGNYTADGFCACGEKYQPAAKNDSGVYQITNAGNLLWFAALVNGDQTHAEFDAQNTAASAVLTANITIPEGQTWTPIGTSSNPYTGTFDGAGNTIEGLKIEGGSAQYQGFVGYLGAGAIQNLTLGESCSVTGGKYSGGVCGWNDAGAITGCTNKGAVNGSDRDTGGICGSARKGSAIQNCTTQARSPATPRTPAASAAIPTALSPAAATPATCPRANMWAASAAIPTQTPPSPTAITPAASPPDNIPAAVCGGNGGAIANCHNAGATDYGVCGNNKSSDENSITNCYYLDTTCFQRHRRHRQRHRHRQNRHGVRLRRGDVPAQRLHQ